MSLLLRVGDPALSVEVGSAVFGSSLLPTGWHAPDWLAGISDREDNLPAPLAPAVLSRIADVLVGWRAIHAISLGHGIPVLCGLG
jgi:hypothetical protein